MIRSTGVLEGSDQYYRSRCKGFGKVHSVHVHIVAVSMF